MKKIIVITLCALAIVANAKKYGMTFNEAGVIDGIETIREANDLAKKTRVDEIDNRFQFSEVSTNGTVTITGRSGTAIVDTGIPLDNFAWQSGVTNLSQLSSFVGSKNQPNGYAGLDENGKISTNSISLITVYFSGGSAFE